MNVPIAGAIPAAGMRGENLEPGDIASRRSGPRGNIASRRREAPGNGTVLRRSGRTDLPGPGRNPVIHIEARMDALLVSARHKAPRMARAGTGGNVLRKAIKRSAVVRPRRMAMPAHRGSGAIPGIVVSRRKGDRNARVPLRPNRTGGGNGRRHRKLSLRLLAVRTRRSTRARTFKVGAACARPARRGSAPTAVSVAWEGRKGSIPSTLPMPSKWGNTSWQGWSP